MITVFTLSYNEQLQLPNLINHYRERFPGCKIVCYDNMSTDDTVSIAKNNNCDVISYDTNNQIVDSKYLEIKNNCWKNASTDWVLVCDVDELLDINQDQLLKEEENHSTIIKSEGYNMVSMNDLDSFEDIKYGYRAEPHDKSYLFNKKFIKEINYEPGSHIAKPEGIINFSNKSYIAYHYHFIAKPLLIKRYAMFAKRLSSQNLKNKWGFHYLYTEEQIHKEYERVRSISVKLL